MVLDCSPVFLALEALLLSRMKSFEHLWQDGYHMGLDERKPVFGVCE